MLQIIDMILKKLFGKIYLMTAVSNSPYQSLQIYVYANNIPYIITFLFVPWFIIMVGNRLTPPQESISPLG